MGYIFIIFALSAGAIKGFCGKKISGLVSSIKGTFYMNMLRMAYERYTSNSINIERFNDTMKDYFNSLNGSWLLGIINKNEFQIREKLSIVAASIVMKHFLQRSKDVIWLPISLDEILRVSGSIGLPKDYLFTVVLI